MNYDNDYFDRGNSYGGWAREEEEYRHRELIEAMMRARVEHEREEEERRERQQAKRKYEYARNRDEAAREKVNAKPNPVKAERTVCRAPESNTPVQTADLGITARKAATAPRNSDELGVSRRRICREGGAG